MNNKHHELLGVPKHANQHRLSRLTMEVHSDELRKVASEVESYTDELIAALEAAEKRNADLEGLLEAEVRLWTQRYDCANSRREVAEKRIAELESENAYIRNRHKELDLLIGKNILVMQAAIIEWQGTGDARKGLAWIYNTLFGPGELPDEAEKDAQAYFDRKYAPLDEELMNLHRWFWELSETERAAAAGKGEAS
ncbi:ead/Ea22-like family protein [Enterobacter hormaechei]|uniref:ead/Ea22-like family protein n=1 Tax=Enterobacter hormaechei TaxID=158836 RepID=UPI00387DC23C